MRPIPKVESLRRNSCAFPEGDLELLDRIVGETYRDWFTLRSALRCGVFCKDETYLLDILNAIGKARILQVEILQVWYDFFERRATNIAFLLDSENAQGVRRLLAEGWVFDNSKKTFSHPTVLAECNFALAWDWLERKYSFGKYLPKPEKGVEEC